MFGSFANGLIISFLPAILLVLLGDVGFEGTTFGDSDFGIIGVLILSIMKLLGLA
jgi:ascorbate PTS system EIIC component